CRSHARDERPRHETQVGMVDAFAACLNLLDGHLSDTSLLCPPNRVKLRSTTSLVSEVPCGYNTLVGDRWIRLSGGHRQRIGIAGPSAGIPTSPRSTRPPALLTPRLHVP